MIRALIFLAITALPVAAQDLPSKFSVTDVASNDVLNIRAQPFGQAPIIGSLQPTAMGVEVITRSENGRWGLVNVDEGTGWASMRFLTEEPGQSFPPASYTCFGTEPFWTLAVDGPTATWSDINGTESEMSFDWTGTGMRPDRFGLRALGDLTLATATIRREACSDGMSDRSYGFGIDALIDLPGQSQPQMVSGCCSLQP